MTAAIEQHSLHSVLRERIVEHLLTGELLRRLWSFGITSVEILRSEFDRGGYDLVADNGPVVRHVQCAWKDRCPRYRPVLHAPEYR